MVVKATRTTYMFKHHNLKEKKKKKERIPQRLPSDLHIVLVVGAKSLLKKGRNNLREEN